MALSTAAKNIVKATAPVVAENALAITSTFYRTMFENNPEVQQFFNKAHQVGDRQPRALADSIIQYALNIDDLTPLGPLVEKIAHRHCALSVKPEHYGIVHSNLMSAIGEVLGDAVTPEIAEGWSEAVLALAGVCIDAEENLYKEAEARTGGWRYEREFEISDLKEVAEDSLSVGFKPTDGYDGSFEYDAGQYLTLRIPETDQAPRHYCITNKPDSGNEITIAVRREEGGLYSNYVHDKIKVGDKVNLGAPMGVFRNPADYKGNIAFVAGGIGISPIMSLLDTYGEQVKAGLVVNRTRARSAFHEDLEQGPADTKFYFTQEGDGRPDLDKETDALIAAAGKDANFFVCGPDHLMDETVKTLKGKGADNVFINVYGTGTIETNLAADEAQGKCPFH